MACNPPFCHGTGGWCNCNCKCCPPPCCSSITVDFRCGTANDNWNGPSPNDGCDCSPVSTPTLRARAFQLKNAPKSVAFPEFDDEPITSEDGVFAFAVSGTCSVPCTNITVTLTTDACCLELKNGVVYLVGSGSVTAELSPGSGYGSCKNLTAKINGSAGTYNGADCDVITVTVESEDSVCCPCCQVGEYTCGGAANAAMAALLYRQRSITKGRGNKLKVNPTAMAEQIQARGVRIIKPRSTTKPRPKPPTTSP